MFKSLLFSLSLALVVTTTAHAADASKEANNKAAELNRIVTKLNDLDKWFNGAETKRVNWQKEIKN